jgi:hypothetical protein
MQIFFLYKALSVDIQRRVSLLGHLVKHFKFYISGVIGLPQWRRMLIPRMRAIDIPTGNIVV